MNKVKIFTISLILVNALLALPDAPVGGVVSVDSIWRKSNSPIVLTSDVQIAPGVSLSIEAGVSVLFSEDCEILVMGASVNILGTEASPVYFRSVNGSSINARGLMFKSANLSQSTIDYFDVKYLSKAIQIGEETEHNQGNKNNNELLVRNFTLEGGQILTDGYQTGSSIRFENVDIKDSTIKGNYPRSERIYITNGTIHNTTINSDSYNDGIILNSLDITNSNFSLGCCGANIAVIDCNVTDSNFSDYNDYYDVSIQNSTLIRTFVNLPNGYVTVDDSQLIESTLFAGKLIMTDSSLLSCEVVGVRIHNFNNTVSSITGSQITDCGTGIEIMPQASITISGSNIFNNRNYHLNNRSINNIDAKGNYWGELDGQQIENMVVHQLDDLNLGFVDFSNALTIPVEGETYPFLNASSFTFTSSSGVGGTVSPLGDLVYNQTTELTFSATADNGYVFGYWSGSLPTGSETINPLTLNVGEYGSITAIFSQDSSDSDGDELSQYQEVIVYGTDPADADSDDDGFDDGFEVDTGYNPMSISSTPDAISGIETAVKYWFNAANGVNYRIEYSTDLENWFILENDIIGAGGEIIRYYDALGTQKRFYRAKRNLYATPSVLVFNHPSYGVILTDQSGKVLYGLSFDSAGGDPIYIGTAWPLAPQIADPEPDAGVTAALTSGTFSNASGGPWLKINNRPVYTYAADSEPNQASGHGLGSVWFTIKPDGTLNQ